MARRSNAARRDASGARGREGIRSQPLSPGGGEAPAVAVDVAVFTVLDRGLQLLLVCVRRGVFAGRWALPGGRGHADETLEGAARRLLAAETGVRGLYPQPPDTLRHPAPDPQGRVLAGADFAP